MKTHLSIKYTLPFNAVLLGSLLLTQCGKQRDPVSMPPADSSPIIKVQAVIGTRGESIQVFCDSSSTDECIERAKNAMPEKLKEFRWSPEGSNEHGDNNSPREGRWEKPLRKASLIASRVLLDLWGIPSAYAEGAQRPPVPGPTWTNNCLVCSWQLLCDVYDVYGNCIKSSWQPANLCCPSQNSAVGCNPYGACVFGPTPTPKPTPTPTPKPTPTPTPKPSPTPTPTPSPTPTPKPTSTPVPRPIGPKPAFKCPSNTTFSRFTAGGFPTGYAEKSFWGTCNSRQCEDAKQDAIAKRDSVVQALVSHCKGGTYDFVIDSLTAINSGECVAGKDQDPWCYWTGGTLKPTIECCIPNAAINAVAK